MPISDSLDTDYRSLIANSLNLGEGNTTFSWAPQGDNSGIITWILDTDMTRFDGYDFSVHAWVVESSSEFAEGTNNKGTYPSIVRDIINLGSQTAGSASIDLPTPFDGDDLEIHLMYHFTAIDIEEPVIESSKADDVSGLSSISFIASFSMVIAAAAVLSRD